MRVRIHYRFVDDSYWDDGSRYTGRVREYDTITKAKEDLSSIIEGGIFTHGSVGDKQYFKVYADDIKISVYFETKYTAGEFIHEEFLEE